MCTDLFASILYIFNDVHLATGLSLGCLFSRCVHIGRLYKGEVREYEASDRMCCETADLPTSVLRRGGRV